MFTGYFLHKRALEVEQQTREIQQRTREIQRETRESQQQLRETQCRLEELTIQRLVAERQLHDAKRLRYEAEYKLLVLKEQRRRNRRRSLR